ncbi:MAG: CHAT domain-containing protein [bacterium]
MIRSGRLGLGVGVLALVVALASRAAGDASRAEVFAVAEARQAAGDAEGVYVAAESARGVEPPVSVADLRSKLLETDQVLLEYLVGADASLVVLVSQDRCRSARIAAGADSLRALVDSLAAGLSAGDARPSAAVSLHELLIGPLAADIPPEARLVLVTDGPLAALRFAALHDGRTYLVERHPLSEVSSAAALRTRQPGSVAKVPLRATATPAEPPAGAPAATSESGTAGKTAAPSTPPDALFQGITTTGLPPDVILQRAQRAAIARGDAPRTWAAWTATGRMRSPHRPEGEFPLWLVPLGMAAGALMVAIALRLVPRTTDPG